MFDIGGWEIFVILALALIIVGPRDLPVLIRNVGRWVGKARAMARDFQSGMDEAAREIDKDNQLRKATNIRGAVRDEMRKIGADVTGEGDSGSGKPASRDAGRRDAPAREPAGRPSPRPAARRPEPDRAADRRAQDRNADDAFDPYDSGRVDRRPPPARGVEPRRTADRSVAGDDDEAVIGDFQRGARRGSFGARDD